MSPSSRNGVQNAANMVLVVTAVTMLGFYIADRRSPSPISNEGAAEEVDVAIEDWEREAAQGILTGSADAPVQVVEFMDFQCPYCRQLFHRLDTLKREYPGAVAVTTHHFPLSFHELATPAAIGAECAHQQGAFQAFYETVFTEGLGVRSIEGLAEDAGVPDLEAFAGCLKLPVDSFPRIAYGRDLGVRTGVTGTPTVWINGIKLARPPTLERLRQEVEGVLSASGMGGGG